MQKAREIRRKCEAAASIKILRVGFDAEQFVEERHEDEGVRIEAGR